MGYQVLIISEADPDAAKQIRAAVRAELRAWLGRVPRGLVQWPTRAEDLGVGCPLACVFVGGRPASSRAKRQLKIVAERRIFCIPVVPPGAEIDIALPPSLRLIKAQERIEGWQSRAAARLLEVFGFGPGRVRMFLSYAHDDGLEVARQLEQELRHDGVELFFDESGRLDAGDVLHDAFHDEIARSDLVVQLRTPEARASQWVAKEQALAAHTSAGLFAIVWPGESPPQSDSWEAKKLKSSDFADGSKGRILTGEAVRKILTAARAYRTRAVALRRARLGDALVTAARARGWDAWTEPDGRAVVVERDTGRERCRPLVGVPSSQDLQHAAKVPPQGTELRLVVDDRVLLPAEPHLGWLRANLRFPDRIHLNFLNEFGELWPAPTSVAAPAPAPVV